MEKCYEYLGCKKQDCPMFIRDDDKPCWEVEGTLCSHPAIELISKKMGSKKEACKRCIYYDFSMKSKVGKIEESLSDNSIVQKKIDTLKKRILIVDDEQRIRNVMQDMLSTEFDVYTANNGEQALELMSKTEVDLLISDIFMPDKNGLEVISLVTKKHPSVKIIAMSGLVNQMGMSCLKVAEKIGASANLAKPFSKDELIFSIHNVLS